jgi:hypothetical protein
MFDGGGVPSLYIHNGDHSDDRRTPDIAPAIDADLASRIVRFVFHVSQEIANARSSPQWSVTGRRQLLAKPGK